MARPRNLDLSRQQRRVLELMARGRTNYDIAQDLGVSLEGAKYHIRQVFDKLGVDSREEAVAAWQASRGSLFERVRGWLWPVGVVAAGGVVVIAVMVVAVVLILGDSSGAAREAPAQPPVADVNVPAGVWVAEIVPPDPAADDGIGSLQVFQAGHKADAHTFNGEFYALPLALQWSRDGSRLSAIGVDSPNSPPALRIFERDGGTWATRTIAIGQLGSMFSWSPDGRLLAVIGTDRVGSVGLTATLFDASGKTLATTNLPPVGSPTYGIDYAPSWRSDSDAAAWGVNGRLLVLTQDGIRDYTPPGGAPHQRLVVARWSDDRHVAVILGDVDGNQTGYRVDVSGDDAKWEHLDQPPATPVLPLQPEPSAAVSALWNHPPDVPLTNVGITADSGASVFGPGYSQAGTGRPVDFQVIVDEGNGHLTKVDLGMRRPPTTGLGSAYNIVVTK